MINNNSKTNYQLTWSISIKLTQKFPKKRSKNYLDLPYSQVVWNGSLFKSFHCFLIKLIYFGVHNLRPVR